jgi:hypothetical protein
LRVPFGRLRFELRFRLDLLRFELRFRLDLLWLVLLPPFCPELYGTAGGPRLRGECSTCSAALDATCSVATLYDISVRAPQLEQKFILDVIGVNPQRIQATMFDVIGSYIITVH